MKKETTLREVINGIDFNNQRMKSEIGWSELFEMFGIYDTFWSEDTRLKAYYTRVHYCTDTWVGARAYFLDGTLIAVSQQPHRKADEDFKFVSQEAATKLRDYLYSLREENFTPSFDLANLDEVIPNTYTVEHNSEVLHKHALYNGEKVEVVGSIKYRNEGMLSPDFFSQY